jgi:hypothetical protein
MGMGNGNRYVCEYYLTSLLPTIVLRGENRFSLTFIKAVIRNINIKHATWVQAGYGRVMN